MWTRLGLALGLLLCGVAPALADGYVESSGTYAEGAQIRGNRYDTGGNQKVTLGTYLTCEDGTNLLCRVSGGAVRQTTVESQITDTTSAAVAVPTGSKTFMGVLTGAGAVAQTMKLYGAFSSAASNGVLLCTLTITGTTAASDACPVITANFSYYYVTTTASSGLTTAVMYAMY